MCLSLVAKRELHLERGNVVVPCGKWKLFLKCLLEAFVKKEINKIEYNEALAESVSDHRLQELKDIVLTTFLKNSVPSTVSETVNSNEIEKLKALFPPCMGYLYSNLKINHRLSHSARFNFSLFLKDIGMPLNESITFWRNEYSKQSKCQSKCSHSWQKNSTKYTYSIRHLYGLEGKRANYSAPSCSKIQGNNLGASDEGGCPFLNFDINQLKNILDPTIVQNKEDFDLVMLLKSQNKTLEACNYYCKSLSKAANLGTLSEKCEHKTPVEYFVMLNKQLNYLDDR